MALWLEGRRVPEFVSCCLRSIGQVVFMNNPLTGALILVGLLLQSPFFGLMALFGAACSNLFAVLLGLDQGLYRSGLFGYNGVLVGCCLATFDSAGDWNAALLGPVAFVSVFSTIIFVALGNFLVGPYGVTPLTLPFNLATAMVLLSSHSLNNVEVDLFTSLSKEVPPLSLFLCLSLSALLLFSLRDLCFHFSVQN
jgi:urea transporter